MREEIIRNVLGPVAINSRDAAVVASATAAALGVILTRLDLIVGSYATDTVFSRSHRIARHTSVWLTPANGRSRAESLDCVATELATRSAAEASHASVALVGALGDLLISLIGEALTYRMLGWTSGGPDDSVWKDRA